MLSTKLQRTACRLQKGSNQHVQKRKNKFWFSREKIGIFDMLDHLRGKLNEMISNNQYGANTICTTLLPLTQIQLM